MEIIFLVAARTKPQALPDVVGLKKPLTVEILKGVMEEFFPEF